MERDGTAFVQTPNVRHVVGYNIYEKKNNNNNGRQ